MHKIIVTKGIQGSGKTTWAKAWVAEDPEHRIRINNDDITSMWGQPFGTSGLYKRLKTIRIDMIAIAIDSQLDIVIDNMNLSKSSIQEIEDILSEYTDYHIEYKDFTNVPLEVCIERDSHRTNPIGKQIITETYNKYLNGK